MTPRTVAGAIAANWSGKRFSGNVFYSDQNPSSQKDVSAETLFGLHGESGAQKISAAPEMWQGERIAYAMAMAMAMAMEMAMAMAMEGMVGSAT
ncbi:MAG: hypothetical protein Q8S94_06455 [Pseudohongiella sp.]|nr:hypothetical protein [Pseudohongiella sp.]